MSVLTNILRLEKAYREEKHLAAATLSKKVGQGGAFFARLHSGNHTCNIKTAEKVTQWFSDHWPEGLDWPEGIDRPKPISTQQKKGAA